MRITKINIKNFRLLHDVELRLEDVSTVIVGRNNCGKTSLSDVIRKFLDERGTFNIEDFSSASYDGFCAALRAFVQKEPLNVVRALVPAIELRIRITYDKGMGDFGPLKGFVIDTNDASTEALVVCRRELADGGIEKLFEGHDAAPLQGEGADAQLAEESRVALFKSLADRVPRLYETKMLAEDPNDSANVVGVSPAAVKKLISLGFVNAQRGLDGSGSRDADILAKVLETLFLSASLPTADGEQKSIAEGLQGAVDSIQTAIDDDFKSQLRKLMPTIKEFGYPGLDGPELLTETRLEVARLLTDFTKIRYSGYAGVQLPEAYNGLGFRNLLFILLRIVGFYRQYRAEPHAPGVQLIVIEEPEAHLHPQMQEVFIRHLSSIVENLTKEADGAAWPVQFIVSTHSPHVANEARFEAIRYFAVSSKDQPVGVRCTEVRDLRAGLAGTHQTKMDFLHQYLTLTRCDLFFADKAVLVEGTSERLMLPQIIRALDAADETLKLRSQYVTIMEVGGAYAHLFFPLLRFLGLRTLVITDLDAVRKTEKGKWEACLVHEGERTSNACIKQWFSNATDEESKKEAAEELKEEDDEGAEHDGALTPAQLLAAKDGEKINGELRIAYEIPEKAGDPCGRTFEDAFILANATLFGLPEGSVSERAMAAQAVAEKQKKSKFALKYAIRETGWSPPRYIEEGLRWLAQGNLSVLDPGLAVVAQAAAAETPIEAERADTNAEDRP